MRRASSAWFVTRGWLVAVGAMAAALLAGCSHEAAPPVKYTRAEMTVVQVDNVTAVLPPPPADAQWREVALPLTLRPQADERNTDGGRRYDVIWLRFPAPAPSTAVQQMYLPRVTFANNPQLRTKLPLPFRDSIHEMGPRWNVPLRFLFDPAQLNSPGLIELGMFRVHGRPLFLSPVWVGADPSAIDRWYRVRLALHTGLSMTLAATLGVFAVFAFGFWLRRRESLYLIAAAAMTAWVVRLLHYFVGTVENPEAAKWFTWISIISMLWVMLFTYQFALRLHQTAVPWMERALLAFAVLFTVGSSPLTPIDTMRGGTVIYAVASLVSLAVILTVTWHFVRKPDRGWGLIAVCLWLSLIFGVHDFALRGGWVHPQSIFLMPLSAALIFGVFGYAILARYTDALSSLERMNLVLDERVHEARRALETSYAELARIQAEQAAAAERERLVRDMHDGIGSALSSSLLLAEQGRLDDKATADVLRQCIEDLRLTIDSADAAEGDLVTLLATLRFRIGNRLAAAGIAMDWEVGDIPPQPRLTADTALQVLRIVQEALTNVIKHARARRVRVSISHGHAAVRVCIDDDGVGFKAVAAPAGRGLVNQRRRAAAIGATIDVDSSPTGTRVTLTLPSATSAA